MFFEGETYIDEKRYEEIIRLGYESAKKKLEGFEKKYACTFLDLDKDVKDELSTEEYEEWRISFLAIKKLGKILNASPGAKKGERCN